MHQELVEAVLRAKPRLLAGTVADARHERATFEISRSHHGGGVNHPSNRTAATFPWGGLTAPPSRNPTAAAAAGGGTPPPILLLLLRRGGGRPPPGLLKGPAAAAEGVNLRQLWLPLLLW